MTSNDITLCGHGSGTPSLKNMKDYCASRYSQVATNGKRKELVAVRRYKNLTYQNKVAFHDTYKTILGRNQYSQALRTYVYTSYHGTYYSDCSSSGCFTLKQIGLDCPDLNTAGIYNSNRFETVPVNISKGQITNPECLEIGDALLFVGNDPSRPLQIGHVEYVYEIKGGNELTNEDIRKSVAAVAIKAKAQNWPYGDDHDNPPCPPIACDRGIFRALWDLDKKFQDQKAGGETVYTADAYLTKHGFVKNTTLSNVKPNSIVFMKWNGDKAFHWKDHMFYCTNYNHSTGKCSKYDFGSDDRIKAGGYFENVAFNEWSDRKFYASYRLPDDFEDYIFTPKEVKAGSTGASQYLANEILLAYNIKGVKKDGKLQNLELNNNWTTGDMAAMCQWKLDRIRNGDVNLCKGPYGAGEIGSKDWESLLSSKLPFRAKTIPNKEKQGPSVLLCQRILRANGYKGADGKALTLDAIWGVNTEAAVKKFQKANNLSETGIVTNSIWKLMLKNL